MAVFRVTKPMRSPIFLLTLITTLSASAGEVSRTDWSAKLRRYPVKADPPASGTLFQSKSWVSPQPIAKPAEPQLPAFPFQYLGRVSVDGKADAIYLSRANQIHRVVAGTAIDGTYKVEAIHHDSLEVTYLPMQRKQVIPFSDMSMVARSESYIIPPATTTLAQAKENADTQVQADQSKYGAKNAETQSRNEPAGGAVSRVRPISSLSPAGVSTLAASNTSETTTIASGALAEHGASVAGGMVIRPPTIKQMPMSAPTIAQMPMTLPPSGSMPIGSPTTRALPESAPSSSAMQLSTPPAAQ